MNKPNKTFIKKWIRELKSGKYEKGKSMLRSFDNKFCCLGVACDMMDSNLWKKGGFGYDYMFKGSCGLSGTLDTKTQKKLGIETHHGSLIAINDNSDTFEPVIEYLEKLIA